MSIETPTGPLQGIVGRATLDADVDTMRDVYMSCKQRAALERLQADALRYRWLREFCNRDASLCVYVRLPSGHYASPKAHWLDIEIAAAMERNQPPN